MTAVQRIITWALGTTILASVAGVSWGRDPAVFDIPDLHVGGPLRAVVTNLSNAGIATQPSAWTNWSMITQPPVVSTCDPQASGGQGFDCGAALSCEYVKTMMPPGRDDYMSDWYWSSSAAAYNYRGVPGAIIMGKATSDPQRLTGPTASAAEVKSLYPGIRTRPVLAIVDHVTPGSGKPNTPGAEQFGTIGTGACMVLRYQGRVGYRVMYYTAAVSVTAGTTGCTIDARDASLALAPGETRTTTVQAEALCDGDTTLNVRVYGMGPNGELKFDGPGVTGTVAIDGVDAHSVPAVVPARAGENTALPIVVTATADPTATGGEWSATVLILTTPA